MHVSYMHYAHLMHTIDGLFCHGMGQRLRDIFRLAIQRLIFNLSKEKQCTKLTAIETQYLLYAQRNHRCGRNV